MDHKQMVDEYLRFWNACMDDGKGVQLIFWYRLAQDGDSVLKDVVRKILQEMLGKI